MKIFLIVFSIVLALTIGFISGAFYSRGIPASFFNFNMMQIATPIIQIAIAIGLALFVNIKLSNKSKRKEIIFEEFEKYNKTIEELHRQALIYMDKKDASLESDILKNIRLASSRLRLIEDITKMTSDFALMYPIEEIEEDLLEYKRRLTGRAFKSVEEYCKQQKMDVQKQKEVISSKLAKQKISLYL